MKKICVVTGSRAEYGLLKWVMRMIGESSRLNLQVIVTGTHLSPEFGLTFREIESDGFQIDRKVEMLLSSDTTVGITKSVGLALCGFSDVLADLKPDLVLVLGDRYEIFAAATAAMIARVPIAHLHGGEKTEGAIDEAIRHAITKMSHLHFVAAEEYRQRVIQLGEAPERVFNVGGLGLDGIRNLELLDRAALEKSLEFKLGPRNLLVTFHPTTLEENTAATQMAELLAALDTLPQTHLLFTMPNADTEGRALIGLIKDYVERHPQSSKAFTSLGQLRYLSCLSQVDGVVGNSSSGLIEAPSFKIGTINIGDRQRGRLKASSVIDCKPDRLAIKSALEELFSDKFRAKLTSVVNPYGTGGASRAIVGILENTDLSNQLKKRFFDLVKA